MSSRNPFIALGGSDVRTTSAAEIDKILDGGEPVSRLMGSAESADGELAFDRAYHRRKRLFGASSWTLDQALALFLDFVEIERLPRDDFVRLRLQLFCGAGRDRAAMKEVFDKAFEPDADALIKAVDSCRDHFSDNGNRMHPLLWMRWILSYAPQVVTSVFWTEFGVWRNENFAVCQPMIRGVDGDGMAMFCRGSESLPYGLMPIEGFIHEPMDEHNFTSTVNWIYSYNANLIRKEMVDYLVSKRSNASKRTQLKTRFDKARKRLGPVAMHEIECVLADLYAVQGKARG